MLFNSLSFAAFLILVFVIHWTIGNDNRGRQNAILFFSSCFFYAFWDWRFVFLLLFSIGLDYYAGLMIFRATSKKHRLLYLWLSITINVGLLCFFKYCNFFLVSFSELISGIGFQSNIEILKIILPVGISFYTFHGLSYNIDLYYKKIKPENSLITYSVFVSFFPLLVAGPIERASHLLPQLTQPRVFSRTKAVDGLKQILWGLFKKVVIADNCAEYVNLIFKHHESYSGSSLFVGAFLFTIQIYCDFSGYTDMAIGVGKLFGIDLMDNFAFPYFSKSIGEFWRRWHISLSTWFRDYLYFPLGGNKGKKWMTVRNIFIVFLVSGFWHGANWTFIIWGLIHGLYMLPSILFKQKKQQELILTNSMLRSLKSLMSILCTFLLVLLAWVFFRSETVKQAFEILGVIASKSLFTWPSIGFRSAIPLACFIAILITIEWFGRFSRHALEFFGSGYAMAFRWSLYAAILTAIIFFHGNDYQFVYFQF